jgi:hypothetical protein
MRRSKLLIALFSVVAVMLLAGTVSSAPRKKTVQKIQTGQDTITLKGTFTITADLKGMKLRDTDINRAAEIPMPPILTVETQDDDPALLAEIFRDKGYIRRRADVFLKTSQSVNVSGKKVHHVYEVRNVKGETRLESLKGNIIPARTGDYYIGIKSDTRSRDAVILRYVKIHVDKVMHTRTKRR